MSLIEFNVNVWSAKPWRLLSAQNSLRLLSGNPLLRSIGVRVGFRQLSAGAAGLLKACSQLPEAAKYLEDHFLTLQTNLEQLSGATQALISHGRNVVNRASGGEMGDLSLDGIIALLEKPLDYLVETESVVGELTRGLRGCLDAITQLIQIERALGATVAPLQITQFMFRVESAYLPSEHRQVFHSVTDEIVTLQGQIQSAFSEHVTLLSGLYDDLRSTVETLEQQMSTQGQKIKQKKAELSSYLATARAEILQNAERDVALTRASEDLRQRVSTAVMALQVQDRIAQQLQHAQAGVQEIGHALQESQATSEANGFARIAAMARVEVGQLKAVLGEVKGGDRALREVTAGISALLLKLDSDDLLLKEFSQMTASVSGVIQGLLERFEEIRGMVRTTVATTRLAEASVLPVRAATEQLTSTVQAVAHEMHLIALNFQIQAIQMGQGTGLDVLAAHSTEVSHATTRISMEVAAKVDGLSSAIVQYSDQLSALCANGLRQQENLDGFGERQAAQLHRFRDQTLAEFRETLSALDCAKKSGAAIAALLNTQPAFETIAAVQASVAEFHRESAVLERHFRPKDCFSVEAIESFQRTYTMASERRIHLESLGQEFQVEEDEAPEFWDNPEPCPPDETAQSPFGQSQPAEAGRLELF